MPDLAAQASGVAWKRPFVSSGSIPLGLPLDQHCASRSVLEESESQRASPMKSTLAHNRLAQGRVPLIRSHSSRRPNSLITFSWTQV